METETIQKQKTVADDFLPMLGTDHLELYVGNAKQAAFFYMTAFGFQPLAYKGLETGSRDVVSYVIRQEKITLVLTTPLNSKHPINDHLRKHGDGVSAYAIWVEDATSAYEETTKRGGIAHLSPTKIEDENGHVITSGIKTYGDTVNIFVERKNYNGVFLPGYKKWEPAYRTTPVGLKFVDHCVGNVELGKMNDWVKYYEDVMGFFNLVTFDDKDISTEYSSLMSKVVSNGNGYIKFPINEPASGKKKSQIEEYIDFYEGAGVQHLALATEDIIHTVTELRKRGVEFLNVPQSYYDDILDRVGSIDEELKILRDLNILIDRDEEGYLLQIFTKPLEDRPTLFFEIIQRKGAKSFGKGNFKALFEAIEREQELRGNL
ncbi:MAG: 4-hydroxyphenylpyruvate dioxygenase [Bacteroidetes bacterium]|nr:4-hydroxyphenylpyruvate dioxygenase [Bacteroidota bacterium]